MQLNRVNAVADRVPIRTALISVADKTGLSEFVTELWNEIPDLVIFSTGGTFSLLDELARSRKVQPQVRTISSYTGQPEMQGGLVKTLDYRVYLALLSEQFNPDHQADLKRTGSIPFDLTICSFYPFEVTAADPQATLEDLRTHIDIGGPTMLRASAKNYLRVLPICDASDYPAVLETLRSGEGSTPLEFRLRMALKAFKYTAQYDGAIAHHLAAAVAATDLDALYTDPADASPQGRNTHQQERST